MFIAPNARFLDEENQSRPKGHRLQPDLSRRQLGSSTALWTLSALALAACGGGGGGGGGGGTPPVMTDPTPTGTTHVIGEGGTGATDISFDQDAGDKLTFEEAPTGGAVWVEAVSETEFNLYVEVGSGQSLSDPIATITSPTGILPSDFSDTNIMVNNISIRHIVRKIIPDP